MGCYTQHQHNHDPDLNMDALAITPRRAAKAKLSCNLTPEVADILANHLVEDFQVFFFKTLGETNEFIPLDFFSIKHAKAVVGALNQIRQATPHNLRLLESVYGGEFFPGQIKAINDSITSWMNGNYFLGVLLSRMEHEDFIKSEVACLCADYENAASEQKKISHSNTQAKQELAELARKEKADQKVLEREIAKKKKQAAMEEAAAVKKAAKNHVAEKKKKQAPEAAESKSVERAQTALRVAQAESAATENVTDRSLRAPANI
ncbi:hypothetical protein PCANC_22792 [Puccinia coronata f. sp. avenae]|uniref:Uncharacterized protein n=1 Tax=Puccinia coronata f. sp. avenae TaxID=200324 RepID=A0A2N5U2Z4_9BASI|nr:hypothetical protein PCANC_22792 [Puccinia coronata f. sp. avenae]